MKKVAFALTAVLMLLAQVVRADDTEYYTQHNLWLFKDQTVTANYRVDLLIPVNTKVTIVKERGAKLSLRTIDGKDFTYIVQKKFTTKNLADVKARMLATTPVDLKKFGKDAQQAIKSGEVRPGMTRNEVIVARGYPPEHATLGFDSDTWKYWQTKWNTIVVHFDNNKVARIED